MNDQERFAECTKLYLPEALEWFRENKKNPNPAKNNYNYWPFTVGEAKKDFDHYKECGQIDFDFPVFGIPIWMHGSQGGCFYVFKIGDKYIEYGLDNNEITELF